MEIEKTNSYYINNYNKLDLSYNIKDKNRKLLTTRFFEYPLKKGKREIDIIEYGINHFLKSNFIKESKKPVY